MESKILEVLPVIGFCIILPGAPSVTGLPKPDDGNVSSHGAVDTSLENNRRGTGVLTRADLLAYLHEASAFSGREARRKAGLPAFTNIARTHP